MENVREAERTEMRMQMMMNDVMVQDKFINTQVRNRLRIKCTGDILTSKIRWFGLRGADGELT